MKSERNKLQAQDKYLVSSINSTDQMCTLRKLVKGQFRAKTYDVSLRDVYPVIGSTVQSRNPIKDDSESSEADYLADQGPVVPLVSDSSEDGDDNEDTDDDDDESLQASPRPQRQRTAPVWHKDYYMGPL